MKRMLGHSQRRALGAGPSDLGPPESYDSDLDYLVVGMRQFITEYRLTLYEEHFEGQNVAALTKAWTSALQPAAQRVAQTLRGLVATDVVDQLNQLADMGETPPSLPMIPDIITPPMLLAANLYAIYQQEMSVDMDVGVSRSQVNNAFAALQKQAQNDSPGGGGGFMETIKRAAEIGIAIYAGSRALGSDNTSDRLLWAALGLGGIIATEGLL